MAPKGGGRYVTVAKVDPLVGDWSAPMVPIRFLSRDPATDTRATNLWSKHDDAYAIPLSNLSAAADYANIYYPTVNANPIDGGRTLIAIFPTAVEQPDLFHRDGELFDKYPEKAAMLLSVTVDGVHFAPPLALVSAYPNGGEINDHAVDGVVRVGNHVFFYVHTGVPGTLTHLCPRWMPKGDDLPDSRLVKYALNIKALTRYTRDAVRRLKAAPPDDAFLADANGITLFPRGSA